MSEQYEGQNRRADDPLVNQLKRVQSDLGFRSWTRRRFVLVALVVLLDMMATGISITAVVLVRRQAHANCVAGNKRTAGNKTLWSGTIAKNPIRPLAPNATQAEIDAHDRQVRQTTEFKRDMDRYLVQVKC